MEVLEDGMYTPAPIRWGLKELRQLPSVYAQCALSAMSRIRRQFAQSRVAQVREATTFFFQSLKQDFTDSQR